MICRHGDDPDKCISCEMLRVKLLAKQATDPKKPTPAKQQGFNFGMKYGVGSNKLHQYAEECCGKPLFVGIPHCQRLTGHLGICAAFVDGESPEVPSVPAFTPDEWLEMLQHAAKRGYVEDGCSLCVKIRAALQKASGSK